MDTSMDTTAAVTTPTDPKRDDIHIQDKQKQLHTREAVSVLSTSSLEQLHPTSRQQQPRIDY